jgi:hypothetical protein
MIDLLFSIVFMIIAITIYNSDTSGSTRKRPDASRAHGTQPNNYCHRDVLPERVRA